MIRALGIALLIVLLCLVLWGLFVLAFMVGSFAAAWAASYGWDRAKRSPGKGDPS